jgi:ETC complex I subunit conserved region
MKRARIYKPTKTAMQSGKAKTRQWCLEFIPDNSRFIEPIMGWTGASDMYGTEVVLNFASKEDAIIYAQANNIFYELIEPQTAKVKLKSYSDNYKYSQE